MGELLLVCDALDGGSCLLVVLSLSLSLFLLFFSWCVNIKLNVGYVGSFLCRDKFLVSVRSSNNFERGVLCRFCLKRFLLSEFMHPSTRLTGRILVVLGGVGPLLDLCRLSMATNDYQQPLSQLHVLVNFKSKTYCCAGANKA